MKRVIIACSITLLLTAFVMFILFEVVSARQNAQQADEVLTIASDILKEERTLLVHLPIGYDENPQGCRCARGSSVSRPVMGKHIQLFWGEVFLEISKAESTNH